MVGDKVLSEGDRLEKLADEVEREGYPRMAEILRSLASEVKEVGKAIDIAEHIGVMKSG